MSITFAIIFMFFCHIIADYNLQGWLASAKQKEYWQKNAPQELYEYDYICALIMHSISWTFMVMLPIAYTLSFNFGLSFIIGFIINTIFHALIDDLKANKKKINLWTDQLFHIFQILITAIIFL